MRLLAQAFFFFLGHITVDDRTDHSGQLVPRTYTLSALLCPPASTPLAAPCFCCSPKLGCTSAISEQRAPHTADTLPRPHLRAAFLTPLRFCPFLCRYIVRRPSRATFWKRKTAAPAPLTAMKTLHCFARATARRAGKPSLRANTSQHRGRRGLQTVDASVWRLAPPALLGGRQSTCSGTGPLAGFPLAPFLVTACFFLACCLT